jgi:Lipopolysaccharide-assembly
MTFRNKWLSFALLLLLGGLPMLQGCGVYSFTGATVDDRLSTFTVVQLTNQASLVVPTLAQSLSERLRQKMLQQTSLKYLQVGGDVQFSGAITRYDVVPQAVTSGSQTALNRLTITLTIQYVNKVDPQKNYEQSFTQFEDFAGNLSEVQSALIQRMSDRLVDIIFNKTFSDW